MMKKYNNNKLNQKNINQIKNKKLFEKKFYS